MSAERDLASRIKELNKSLGADASEQAIKILEGLKKDSSPTEEHLRVGLT